MKFSFLFAAIAMTGCGASVAVSELNPSPRQLSARSEVEVFSANAPAHAYVAVALISSRQESTAASRDGIIAALKAKAAEYGCDGLILGGRTSLSVGDSAYLRGYDATCIVYQPAVAAVPAPVPAAAQCSAPTPPAAKTISPPTAPAKEPPVVASQKTTPGPTKPATVSALPKPASPKEAAIAPDARALLGQACGSKDGPSCHRLGVDFELGKNGAKNLHEAAQAYDHSCALGDKNDCRRAELLRKRL